VRDVHRRLRAVEAQRQPRPQLAQHALEHAAGAAAEVEVAQLARAGQGLERLAHVGEAHLVPPVAGRIRGREALDVLGRDLLRAARARVRVAGHGGRIARRGARR
jgi:hypothetical protein